MRITPYNMQKAFRYLKHYGFKEFLIRLREKQEPENIPYAEYYQSHKVTEKELEKQRQESDEWAYRPLISYVVMQAGAKTEEETRAEMERMEELLKAQSYTNWELLNLSASTTDSNSSLQNILRSAAGEYLAFIETGDTLEPSATYEIAQVIRKPAATKQSGVHWEKISRADIIYTDEDRMVTAEGIYAHPQFKPDYSPALLAEDCYIRHLLVVRKEIAVAAAAGMISAWDVDDVAMSVQAERTARLGESGDLDGFVYACVSRTEHIIHIPKVLYHAGRSTDAAWKEDTVQQVYTMRPVQAEQREPDMVKMDMTDQQPLISIIIPNKDEQSSLETCLASIARSTYPNYEVIIVENNSTDSSTFTYYEKIQQENPNVRVVTWKSDGTFNYSAINNYGVSEARGEYLVFLNNDIELITPDWLEAMLAQCCKEQVAAVGAKLYYPDDTIQHAGIIVGIGGHARGVAANMCVGLPRGEDGYMNRASIRQNMSAVTAACMMMKRSVFEEVGGFTERLTVAFNDVDLCLKARKAGYLIVYEPYVEGCHYESKSRGQEDTEAKLRRFQTEIEYMRTEWNDILKDGDPYYNPNLTRYRTDYSLRGR